MDTESEIVALLREIRDIQKERLILQKKSLEDIDRVQGEALRVQAESVALQKRGAVIQKGALVACAFLIVVAIWVGFR